MDDIVHQFKGVLDGLQRKIVRSPSLSCLASPPNKEENILLSHTEQYMTRASPTYIETPHSLSDDDIHGKERSTSSTGWHSDNELSSKNIPPRIVKTGSGSRNLASRRWELGNAGIGQHFSSKSFFISNLMEDQNSIMSEMVLQPR